MEPVVAIALVFFGCCSNIYFLELLVKQDPGVGVLATFSQFLFIAVHGFIFTARFGTKKPQIHISHYAALVIIFFAANVCNNYAFNFNISMPLHMIIRSGSLIANMIMGVIILKRTYSLFKISSVLAITVGIVICTLESGKVVKAVESAESKVEKADIVASTQDVEYLRWIFGVTILLVALFLSARLGIYQEVLFKTHGKHNEEALFYTHMLPMPGFIFLYPHLWSHWLTALESPPIFILDFPVPSTVLYLIGNMFTQYICISSVYALTTECTSLTVTLVVTLRKFLSLVFSIIYFKNPFTEFHWLGTFFIFAGTVGFTMS